MGTVTAMENMITSSFDDSIRTSSSEVDRLILMVASVVIGIIGAVGNGLVIYVCVRYPLRGVTNVFVCNQSLIDFFSSVIFLVRYGMLSAINTHVSTSPNVANFLCKFWFSDYLLWGSAIASTVNLVYLNIERYLAVFHPIMYRQKLTKTRGKLVAILPWIYGLIHELLWALFGNKSVKNDCVRGWVNEAVGFIAGILTFVGAFLLPLIIMSFVYIQIWRKLRNQSSKQLSTVNEQISRNVVKTMAIVSLTFVICWGPNQILYFYSNVGGVVEWTGVLYRYSVVSALANMCINPFIYAFHYQDFRSKLAKIFTVHFCVPQELIQGPLFLQQRWRSLRN